ncbi:uncharacterized protein RHIMIDRAFT_234805 [Rhizopus microsporus ATCC 52813]|uniref:Uncharacterized protein n=1 Tax=Rhizopus microsporus ATCC 52813 TaxID=1340429 RepID=A0A2G4T379_RHIZD|nr:uncharacterized protein RHIMIDRAFT_234805 [Rhizopus microsporus ATCC 52813]PHZ15457.1 hypothetical protein RHIMIDRAFT_234805 [Rhizopus microsporus ATCC 52813]
MQIKLTLFIICASLVAIGFAAPAVPGYPNGNNGEESLIKPDAEDLLAVSLKKRRSSPENLKGGSSFT